MASPLCYIPLLSALTCTPPTMAELIAGDDFIPNFPSRYNEVGALVWIQRPLMAKKKEVAEICPNTNFDEMLRLREIKESPGEAIDIKKKLESAGKIDVTAEFSRKIGAKLAASVIDSVYVSVKDVTLHKSTSGPLHRNAERLKSGDDCRYGIELLRRSPHFKLNHVKMTITATTDYEYIFKATATTEQRAEFDAAAAKIAGEATTSITSEQSERRSARQLIMALRLEDPDTGDEIWRIP
jgi:hypothetical protein